MVHDDESTLHERHDDASTLATAVTETSALGQFFDRLLPNALLFLGPKEGEKEDDEDDDQTYDDDRTNDDCTNDDQTYDDQTYTVVHTATFESTVASKLAVQSRDEEDEEEDVNESVPADSPGRGSDDEKANQKATRRSSFEFKMIEIVQDAFGDDDSATGSDTLTDSDSEDEDSVVSTDETFIFDSTDMAQKRARVPNDVVAREGSFRMPFQSKFKNRWNEKLRQQSETDEAAKRYKLVVKDDEPHPETELKEISEEDPPMPASQPESADSNSEKSEPYKSQEEKRVRRTMPRMFRWKKASKKAPTLATTAEEKIEECASIAASDSIQNLSFPDQLLGTESEVTADAEKREPAYDDKRARREAAFAMQLAKRKAEVAKQNKKKEEMLAATIEKKMQGPIAAKQMKKPQQTSRPKQKRIVTTLIEKTVDHNPADGAEDTAGFEVHAFNVTRFVV